MSVPAPIIIYTKFDVASGLPSDLNFMHLCLATTELDTLPAVEGNFSKFPPWAQIAIKKAMNTDFKDHLDRAIALEKAVSKLKTHKSNATFPSAVLAAVPGFKDFHSDKILSENERLLFSNTIEATILDCRSTLLDTMIESSDSALKKHRFNCSSAVVLSRCRDYLLKDLQDMGYSVQNNVVPQHVTIVTRALCHLRFQINEKLELNRWNSVQQQRQKEKSLSAASAAMDVTSDLSPSDLRSSIDRIVKQEIKKELGKKVGDLTKAFKKTTISRTPPPKKGKPSGSRPSPSGSRSSGPRPSSSASRNNNSGKGSRPSALGSTKGRISKGAPTPNRRLAPPPTPFKVLKGKRG
mgnify:CR=1 FL=1